MTEPLRNAAGFTHREVKVVIFGLMMALFLAALNQTIVATALPNISSDLHGSGHLTWVVAAYLLTSTAATPIYGKLSDMYGRKRLLQISMATFVVMSVLCALASSMTQLILFRALQGLGGGGLMALSHAAVGDVVTPRERGRYQGYLAGVLGAASILGPVLGGYFAAQWSWRWVFWINVPLGIICIIVSNSALKRLVTRRLGHRIDYAGALLIMACIGSILLLTTMGGNDVPWSSPVVLGLAVAAISLGSLAVLQERRAPEPIIAPKFFRNRIFVTMNSVALLAFMNLIGSTVFIPIYMQLVHGLPIAQSGLMLIPFTGVTFIGSLTTGQIMTRTGYYRIPCMTGQALNIFGFVGLAFTGFDTSLWLVGALLMCCGLGTGINGPTNTVSIQNAVEHRDIGAATAAVASFRSMGGSFGVALFGAVLIGALNNFVGAVPGAGFLSEAPAVALLHAGSDALGLAPAGQEAAFGAAVVRAFHVLFYLCASVSALAFTLVFLLRELPLRTSIQAPGEPPKSPAA